MSKYRTLYPSGGEPVREVYREAAIMALHERCQVRVHDVHDDHLYRVVDDEQIITFVGELFRLQNEGAI